MKYIKQLTAAALIAAMSLTATSCQLSKLMPAKTEDPANTTSPLTTFTMQTAAETIDLQTADLTAYVTLGNYKGLTATESVTPITDELLESELNTYISSAAIYEEITDRPTTKGDTVVMDYVGTLDGVAFAGGTAQGQTIELSENSGYIDGFADGLIGVTPGSTVELNLTFPADYGATELAGKATVFTVTVQYILGEQITPELTDAFITKFTAGEFTSVENFRAYYREYLETMAIDEAHTAAISSLWSQVFENSTFHSVPEQKVTYYYEQSKAQYESYAAAYGMTYESILSVFGLTDESLRQQAEQYAKQDLVFYAVVQAEGLTISDSEYSIRIQDYIAGSGATAAEFEAYYGRDAIIESMLWDKMLETIYSYAVIQ